MEGLWSTIEAEVAPVVPSHLLEETVQTRIIGVRMRDISNQRSGLLLSIVHWQWKVNFEHVIGGPC